MRPAPEEEAKGWEEGTSREERRQVNTYLKSVEKVPLLEKVLEANFLHCQGFNDFHFVDQ